MDGHRRDPESEVLIITGTGDPWQTGNPDVWKTAFREWSPDSQLNMYHDAFRLLENLVFCVDIPTIGVITDQGRTASSRRSGTSETRRGVSFDPSISPRFTARRMMVLRRLSSAFTIAFLGCVRGLRLAPHECDGRRVTACAAAPAARASAVPARSTVAGDAGSCPSTRVQATRCGKITLETWQRFAEADPLTPRAVERMVLGVSTRKYVRSIEAAPPGLLVRRTNKSAASRRLVAATREKLADMVSTDLSELGLCAIMIDGIHVAEHVVLVALGIDSHGENHTLGIHAKGLGRGTRSPPDDLVRPIIDAHGPIGIARAPSCRAVRRRQVNGSQLLVPNDASHVAALAPDGHLLPVTCSQTMAPAEERPRRRAFLVKVVSCGARTSGGVCHVLDRHVVTGGPEVECGKPQ